MPNLRSTLRRELNLCAARLMLFGQRELHGVILPVCVATFAETACQLLRFGICIMNNSEQEPISTEAPLITPDCVIVVTGERRPSDTQ